jgi:hypothetical protein
MPLEWSVSHEDKLVFLQVTDGVALDEVLREYAAARAAGVLQYRKLVDLSFAQIDLGPLNLATLAAAAMTASAGLVSGPVAFVVTRDVVREMVEVFDRKANLDRPLRIFRDIASARQWLDEVAPVGRDAAVRT